ncbi:MAG TPA: TadE/TadG family type IV pilus assembly protein [Sphingomicrobium sp.]
MRKLRSPIRDERGAAVIEIAIVLPTLVMFLWGIFQLGIVFQAIAGMQHALGEGARLATVCQNPTAAGVCSTATDLQIQTRVNEKLFGTGLGNFAVAVSRPVDDPSTPTVNEANAGFLTITTTFSMTPNFLLFDGPVVNLTRSKKVYIA